MKTNNLYQKVLISQLLLFSCAASYAQVVWNLKGGVAQGTMYSFEDDKEHKIILSAGLELEIPLNEMFNLETGLRYRYQTIEVAKESQEGITHTVHHENLDHHIELPLRLTYKLNFSDELSLHAGVGPYASISPEGSSLVSNTVQVGIEPCVALNWKNLSLGVSYNNPCFYKGFDTDYKQGVMLTLGIRFGSDAWEGIGSGLATAASVGAAVAGAYAESEGYTAGNSYSADSYSTSNSYSTSSDTSSGSSSGKNNAVNSNKPSMSEVQAKNTDSDTYSRYETQLIQMRNYPDTYNKQRKNDIQRKMKSIRKKWEDRGFKMYHSELEDWDGSY